MLALALAFALQAEEPALPSLVDHVVTQALLDDKRPAEAKAVTPNVKTGVPAAAPADAASDLKKAEALLASASAKKPDAAKAALLAFKRALAKAPKSATPLWGISRAADVAGDPSTARRYAALYVMSSAPDRDADTAAAAQWRLEQPDETQPLTTAPTTPATLAGPGAIPTSATPLPPSTTPATPPKSTPY
ncbi:MAG TPA: hypothetical protein VGO62_12140 [Myxococcota bacterium]|jgi:hypothetical protein